MIRFMRYIAVVLGLIIFSGCATMPFGHVAPGDTRVCVMTFNILKGGDQLGQPVSRSAEVIRAAEADIVILQERAGSMDTIASELGFGAIGINDSSGIISRWPIEREGRYGARVRVPGVGPVYVFGAHLEAYPYGPYDLRDDPALTEESLIATADETRAKQITPVIDAMKLLIENDNSVFLGGDFNEPSHLDWTSAAAAAGRNFGRSVAWPTSRRVYAVGMIDSYRLVHGDEVREPGTTWTPLNTDPFEVHDRIDILYHAGPDVTPLSAEIAGPKNDRADIAIDPYPSDHHAVVVEYAIR